MPTLYEALCADSEASLADLKACFKRRALSVHPDKQGGSKEAFQLVYAAFERLSDPAARAKYDQTLQDRSTALGSSGVHLPSATRRPKRRKRQQQQENHKSSRVTRSSTSSGGIGNGNISNKSNTSATDISSNNNQTSNSSSRHSQVPSNTQSLREKNSLQMQAWNKEEIRILCRIQRLLKQLTRTERQQIVSAVLSQELRVALADWVTASRSAQPGDSGANKNPDHPIRSDVTVSKRLCTRGSTEDGVASCSSGSSGISDDEDLEQECELFAVCDSTCDVDLDLGGDTPVLDPMVLCDDACVDDQQFKAEGRSIDHGSKEQDPMPASRGASEVKNISCQQIGGRLYYRASMSLGNLNVRARSCTDLAVAVDHLILLTALKRQALCADDLPGASSVAAKTIVERTQLAYEQLKKDAGPGAFADLVATFSLHLKRKYWIGGSSMYTPRCKHLDELIPTWRRFLDLQRGLIQDGSGGTGYLNGLSRAMSPAKLEEHWKHFKQIYLETWGAVSERDRQRQLDRVEVMVAANAPYREKMLQNWNLKSMRREERSQRRLKRAPPAEQAKLLAIRWADLRANRLLRSRAAAARGLDQRRRQRLREAQLAKRRAKAERRERWQRMTGQGLSMEQLWARGE
ncbi:unnamed protein product, partial [Polarella glacialis]